VVIDAANPTNNWVRRGLDLFAGYGDAEAFVSVPDGRRFTYTQLRQRILDTAAWLWEQGIRPGCTIGALVSFSAESLFVQFGAHLLGCRTAYLAPSNPRTFLHDVLGFIDADAFVYETQPHAELGAELVAAAAPPRVFCIGSGGLGPDLVDPPHASELPFDLATITVEPEALFQTGGTTRAPRLVRHGQRFFHAIPKVSQFYLIGDHDRIVHLNCSPTWHSGSQSAAVMTWFSGGLMLLTPGGDVQLFHDLVASERVTSSMISPPGLYSILDHPGTAGADLSSLRSLTVGAAAATPARLTQAIERFGPVLSLVYGLSEIPIITGWPNVDHDPDHPDRLASCGPVWGDAQVEIRDQDGTVLPTGEIGMIWVKGELVMDGYYKMPELNAETMVDGWLWTGDVGRFDADGYLYIVDRVRDMIVTGAGSSCVYSRPLEDALAEHPQVAQAAVIGVPDEFLGEAVHAYVIRTPGATVTADELRELVVRKLNEYWSPREVEFVDAFPLTAFGKVDKKQLRASYLARTQEVAATAGGS
jgi:acyl-CoA synthetase (AMP-forming)/AMP-acid ligase II